MLTKDSHPKREAWSLVVGYLTSPLIIKTESSPLPFLRNIEYAKKYHIQNPANPIKSLKINLKHPVSCRSQIKTDWCAKQIMLWPTIKTKIAIDQIWITMWNCNEYRTWSIKISWEYKQVGGGYEE